MRKVACFSGGRASARRLGIDWIHCRYVGLGRGWLSRLRGWHRRFAGLANAFGCSQQCPAAQPDGNEGFGSRCLSVCGDSFDAPVGGGCRRERNDFVFHLLPLVQGEDTGEG